jgi:N-acetylmuramic acid 6-phosphate etherase
MVDLRATNEKLRDRSERIVMEVCSVARDQARALIDESGGAVRTAIVMHLAGIDRAEAERRLDQAGGVVRRVTGQDPPPITGS